MLQMIDALGPRVVRDDDMLARLAAVESIKQARRVVEPTTDLPRLGPDDERTLVPVDLHERRRVVGKAPVSPVQRNPRRVGHRRKLLVGEHAPVLKDARLGVLFVSTLPDVRKLLWVVNTVPLEVLARLVAQERVVTVRACDDDRAGRRAIRSTEELLDRVIVEMWVPRKPEFAARLADRGAQ